MSIRDHLSHRLRSAARNVRRMLGLSPMQSVMREFQGRGVRLGDLRALECFAFDGHMHTVDYAPSVRALEVWEIKQAGRGRPAPDVSYGGSCASRTPTGRWRNPRTGFR